MKIEVSESDLQKYQELMDERMELMNTMHERIPLHKGNVKKLEKDPIYKDASYNFVIKGIEANDIKDKLWQKAYDEWKGKNEK